MMIMIALESAHRKAGTVNFRLRVVVFFFLLDGFKKRAAINIAKLSQFCFL